MEYYRRILVVLDGTAAGQAALEAALRLAQTRETEVRALVVEGRLPRGAATVAEVEDAKRHQDSFYDIVGRLAVEQATEVGVPLELELRSGGFVDTVAAAAQEWHPDLLVVGRRRRPLLPVPALGTIDRIVGRVGCPVMAVKAPAARRS